MRHSLIAATLVNEGTAAAVRRPARNENVLFHLNIALKAMLYEHPPLEVILITGLVLQLLETLNHNPRIALVHLRSAIRISAEYKKRVANGGRVDPAQAEFIIGRLDPVLAVAAHFAEATLAKDVNKPRIDQHSSEAYALRAKLTRPGIVDCFRSLTDARNSLGSQAVKLTKLLALVHSPEPSSKASSAPNETLQHASLMQVPQKDYEDADTRLEHFWRLFQPIFNKQEPVARMLQLHFKILKLMLDDAKPLKPDSEIRSPRQVEDFECNDMISEAISLVNDTSIQRSEDFKIELGLIPPLFYLATTAHPCRSVTRKQAIECLQNRFANRREGAWNGSLAARIAEEVVDLRAELGSTPVMTGISFEAFHHSKANTETASSPRATTGEDSQLWIGCSAHHAPHYGDTQQATQTHVQTHSRMCFTWTTEEIKRLPTNINELVRNAGYQGYFSEAVATTSSPVSTL